jgi:hypothetical protein
MNELQDNLVQKYDWELLEKGNFFNVTLGETDYNGSDYSILSLSQNTNYIQGQAWEGFRKNWIWQSGVNYSPSPLVGLDSAHPGISGVYVNDTFYPSDTVGDYSHYIDYLNGRVVFNNPIPTGSKVQAEYSYKYINVLYASSLPWLREVQYRSLELDNAVSNNKIPEFTVQLPAMAIEVVPKRTMKPFELGSLTQKYYTDVLFHCVAEDEITRNQMLDIVSFQNFTTFSMFDSNLIIENNQNPLDYLGSPVSGALTYPELVNKYPKSFNAWLMNSNVQGMEILNSNLYVGISRCTLETIT